MAESILPRRSRNAVGRSTSFRTMRIRPPRSVTNTRVESNGGAVRYVGRKNVPTRWSVGVPAGGGGGGGGGGGLVGGELNQSAQAASRHSSGSSDFNRVPPPLLPV